MNWQIIYLSFLKTLKNEEDAMAALLYSMKIADEVEEDDK